jgi:hypothetical protein
LRSASSLVDDVMHRKRAPAAGLRQGGRRRWRPAPPVRRPLQSHLRPGRACRGRAVHHPSSGAGGAPRLHHADPLSRQLRRRSLLLSPHRSALHGLFAGRPARMSLASPACSLRRRWPRCSARPEKPSKASPRPPGRRIEASIPRLCPLCRPIPPSIPSPAARWHGDEPSIACPGAPGRSIDASSTRSGAPRRRDPPTSALFCRRRRLRPPSSCPGPAGRTAPP